MAFPTTSWSLLAQATLRGGPAEQAALAEFCRRYRAPVVAFIARLRPGRGDAEDLAQGFFAAALDGSLLRRADRARGRFRSFLAGAVLRHLGAEDARATAARRGGGLAPISFDDLPESAAPGAPPEALLAFDRAWAVDLLARVRTATAAACTARLGPDAAVLMQFLPGAAATPAYDEAAARLGWKTARLKTEVFRLRADFRAAVRAEVALTVDSPAEIDAELDFLHRTLASPAA